MFGFHVIRQYEQGIVFRWGKDDDRLVAVVGRYTIENLILNAVHEIGEWLRFDGRRLFPAHLPAQIPTLADDAQGNGSVRLATMFRPPAASAPGICEQQPVEERSPQGQRRHPTELGHLTELTGPPGRFTYLPGTAVHYDPTGPVIRLHTGSRPATGWRATWSTATLDALRHGADAEALIGLVQRDVHGAVVAWEADRICRAFCIDGRRPWRLSAPGTPLGLEATANDQSVDEVVSVTVSYSQPGVERLIGAAPDLEGAAPGGSSGSCRTTRWSS